MIFFLAVSNATCNVGTNPGTWVPYVSPKLRIEKTWQLISSTSKNNTTNLDICLLADNIPWLAGIALPSHSTTVEIIFIGDSTDLKMIELCSINSGNATRGSILGTEVTYCFIPGLRIFHIRFYGVHLNGPYFRDASSTDVLSWLYTSISIEGPHQAHSRYCHNIVELLGYGWFILERRTSKPNQTRCTHLAPRSLVSATVASSSTIPAGLEIQLLMYCSSYYAPLPWCMYQICSMTESFFTLTSSCFSGKTFRISYVTISWRKPRFGQNISRHGYIYSSGIQILECDSDDVRPTDILYSCQLNAVGRVAARELSIETFDYALMATGNDWYVSSSLKHYLHDFCFAYRFAPSRIPQRRFASIALVCIGLFKYYHQHINTPEQNTMTLWWQNPTM